ncbi:IS66 family insertion sequence element accessory protein TnpB [Variovorax sp. MHTC-1]|uniref:IS66 family insertion sequence element accessory protein TnpB n=1 Tax=Variovorax sp. MHTC-1 TaxID=2495593 RepID=UPI001C8D0F83
MSSNLTLSASCRCLSSTLGAGESGQGVRRYAAHQAYLFANRRANRMKILVHDGIGLWLCARRLHEGRFAWPATSATTQYPVSSIQYPAHPHARSIQRAGARLACAARARIFLLWT